MFFHLENAKGRFRFYKELLSSSMGVEAGHMISDDTFGKACHITLKDYLRNELEADTDDKAAGNSRTHIAENRCGCGHHFDLAVLNLHGSKRPIPGKSHFVGNRNL